MRAVSVALIPIVLALAATAAAAEKRCQLSAFAELPVTMEGLRPLVWTKINGVDARFVADSGMFYSMISPAAAAEFKLPTRSAPYGFYVTGIGGTTTPEIATVDVFTLATYPLHKVEFLVGGNDLGLGAVGFLGQNLIRLWDVEYDLANGVIRLIKPENCGSQPLAYWATSQPIGVVELRTPTAAEPHTVGRAEINGVTVHAAFDTGASTSMLSLAAARRAGITPGTAGVKPASTTHGIGRGIVQAWVAPLASFKIGGEEIKHTQVLIAEMNMRNFDMLLGDDFFLSHRIYVANGQKKLYFTYNGGPVFKLESPSRTQSEPARTSAASPAATAAPSGGDAAPANPPAAPAAPASSAVASTADPSLGAFADQPTDAAGFARRGTAFAARNDYEHALADLARACELAPREPDYFYELSRVQFQSGHRDLALQSLDRTLDLKPDHLHALVARAWLRLREPASAKRDLDAADRLAPSQDNLRLQLGGMYEQIAEYPAAIHQYDLWIDAHGKDVGLPSALNARCWAQAEANQNLDRALKDCNAALHLAPKNAAILDSRGLVELRRGELDRAIADYDAALRLAPRISASLYGRGLAKLRKGLQAGGEADLAAASAISPGIAERFASFGLKP